MMSQLDREQNFKEFIFDDLRQAQLPDHRKGRKPTRLVIWANNSLRERFQDFADLIVGYATFETWLPARQRQSRDYLMDLAQKAEILGMNAHDRVGARAVAKSIVKRYQSLRWEQRNNFTPIDIDSDPHIFLDDGTHPKDLGYPQ